MLPGPLRGCRDELVALRAPQGADGLGLGRAHGRSITHRPLAGGVALGRARRLGVVLGEALEALVLINHLGERRLGLLDTEGQGRLPHVQVEESVSRHRDEGGCTGRAPSDEGAPHAVRGRDRRLVQEGQIPPAGRADDLDDHRLTNRPLWGLGQVLETDVRLILEQVELQVSLAHVPAIHPSVGVQQDEKRLPQE